MQNSSFLCCVAVILMISMPVLAQRTGKTGGTPPSSTSGANDTGNNNSAEPNNETGAGHREPCWKEAGIPASVIQQRRSIEQNAKSQALFTPQQEEALKACRAAREAGKQASHQETPKAQATGPCGEPVETSEPAGSSHKFN
jgi:hypothetical protein